MKGKAIIIGSGLSGLVCACLLTRKGMDVTLLEQCRQIGGCLQTFTRKGVKFETGMHYIGSMGEGQALRRLFDELGLTADIPLSTLDRKAYDIVSILSDRYEIPNGTPAFIDAMLQHFPGERDGLQRYFSAIDRVVHASPISAYLRNGDLTPINPHHLSQSASAFIDETIAHPRLRQVLSANAPLYAGERHRTNLYTHALVRAFYHPDAHRITGGSDVIANALSRAIISQGGEIRTGAQVRHINASGDKAVSITLATGEVIPAGCIISTAHPSRTIEMLSSPLIRKAYRDRLLSLPNTVSNFTVYIAFKPDTVPYLNSNFFHYNDEDIWTMASSPASASGRPRQYLYMHLSAVPDQQYADGAVLITCMDYDEVAFWQGSPLGRRGEGYEDFKRQKAELLLAELEQQFPGINASISAYYTSTPLTYRDYTGSERGSTYGILHDATRPLESLIPSRTKLSNLHLCGQSVYMHGALGVMAGAFIMVRGSGIGV